MIAVSQMALVDIASSLKFKIPAAPRASVEVLDGRIQCIDRYVDEARQLFDTLRFLEITVGTLLARGPRERPYATESVFPQEAAVADEPSGVGVILLADRKSTRLNFSHVK